MIYFYVHNFIYSKYTFIVYFLHVQNITFLYLCILCIYYIHIHKIYISENIYKIYLAILAV